MAASVLWLLPGTKLHLSSHGAHSTLQGSAPRSLWHSDLHLSLGDASVQRLGYSPYQGGVWEQDGSCSFALYLQREWLWDAGPEHHNGHQLHRNGAKSQLITQVPVSLPEAALPCSCMGDTAVWGPASSPNALPTSMSPEKGKTIFYSMTAADDHI